MFARSFLRSTARSAFRHQRGPTALPRSSQQQQQQQHFLRSASLFTASIGLGTCPKRRRKQSHEESGEDAYFINTTAGGKESIYAGVFDGCGGWVNSGVDPAIFAHGLARHCKQAASSIDGLDPLQVLESGYAALLRDPSVEIGSSTACVAAIDLSTGRLDVANLGDSGYLVFNLEGDLVHASTPQVYEFNTPYQLAKLPASMRDPNSIDNVPKDADLTHHTLDPHQVVVLASDGFLDNVYTKDAGRMVAEVARQGGSRQEFCQQLALKLRDAARTAGRGKEDTPFAEEARRYGYRYTGGKEDDICLVVMAIDVTPIKAKL